MDLDIAEVVRATTNATRREVSRSGQIDYNNTHLYIYMLICFRNFKSI
jgi:hypothetical protein